MNATSRRSVRRRRPEREPRNRRLIAVLATLGVFGALVAVTQVSLASTHGKRPRGACPPATAAATTPGGAGTTATPGRTPTATPAVSPGAGGGASPTGGTSPVPRNGTNPSGAPYRDHGALQHPGDGQQSGPAVGSRNRGCGSSSSPGTGPVTAAPSSSTGGLEVLANSCEGSALQQHDGFQLGDRCVSTEFGEVGSAANNPSLLITSAPRRVAPNQAFTLRVSTRNLIRDRFLPAGQGGYYKESSLLNEDGLVRGHFHTACRMLASGRVAPAPDPVPAFFVATEDGKGGATPDEVTISIPGLPERGQAQCAVWAGDGSHRIPMMQRANQIPAIDVVRITVA